MPEDWSGAPVLLPPDLAVNLAAPDIRRWLPGNCGVPGVWSFAAEAPGPHAAIVGIVHGNEIAGAILLDRWLSAGIRPVRGRLTFIFANCDAFHRFDPADPTASRFLEDDLNRVWDPALLDGSRRSAELRRARALRPVVDTVDALLDLHSMLWPSDPVMLGGRTEKGGRLGLAIGVPELVVLDEGHASGERLVDYAAFSDPASPRAAVLAEAGPHWEARTVEVMERTAARLLRHLRMAPPELLRVAEKAAVPPRLARVTRTVTAMTDDFAFVREFHGGEVMAERNTLIALDGTAEIRTPHPDCLLVMPTPRPPAGHTAVRLARFDGG
ncbi:MAG TPA: succinylglutamate desuccinylase/aspartoacylase family protein [Acetobacteraceae bacterium]|nr:succinylglutamate desuccinylase/aspartoacylase family protein [Acetobacteraceae bacterium]